MIAPAPRERRADQILARWLDWVGDDGTRLMPNLRRIAAIERRREERNGPDTMTALGDALGIKLRRVGEVADPPPARPVTRRRRRKP